MIGVSFFHKESYASSSSSSSLLTIIKKLPKMRCYILIKLFFVKIYHCNNLLSLIIAKTNVQICTSDQLQILQPSYQSTCFIVVKEGEGGGGGVEIIRILIIFRTLVMSGMGLIISTCQTIDISCITVTVV